MQSLLHPSLKEQHQPSSSYHHHHLSPPFPHELNTRTDGVSSTPLPSASSSPFSVSASGTSSFELLPRTRLASFAKNPRSTTTPRSVTPEPPSSISSRISFVCFCFLNDRLVFRYPEDDPFVVNPPPPTESTGDPPPKASTTRGPLRREGQPSLLASTEGSASAATRLPFERSHTTQTMASSATTTTTMMMHTTTSNNTSTTTGGGGSSTTMGGRRSMFSSSTTRFPSFPPGSPHHPASGTRGEPSVANSSSTALMGSFSSSTMGRSTTNGIGGNSSSTIGSPTFRTSSEGGHASVGGGSGSGEKSGGGGGSGTTMGNRPTTFQHRGGLLLHQRPGGSGTSTATMPSTTSSIAGAGGSSTTTTVRPGPSVPSRVSPSASCTAPPVEPMWKSSSTVLGKGRASSFSLGEGEANAVGASQGSTGVEERGSWASASTAEGGSPRTPSVLHVLDKPKREILAGYPSLPVPQPSFPSQHVPSTSVALGLESQTSDRPRSLATTAPFSGHPASLPRPISLSQATAGSAGLLSSSSMAASSSSRASTARRLRIQTGVAAPTGTDGTTNERREDELGMKGSSATLPYLVPPDILRSEKGDDAAQVLRSQWATRTKGILPVAVQCAIEEAEAMGVSPDDFYFPDTSSSPSASPRSPPVSWLASIPLVLGGAYFFLDQFQARGDVADIDAKREEEKRREKEREEEEIKNVCGGYQECLGLPASTLAHLIGTVRTTTTLQMDSIHWIIFPIPLLSSSSTSSSSSSSSSSSFSSGRCRPPRHGRPVARRRRKCSSSSVSSSTSLMSGNRRRTRGASHPRGRCRKPKRDGRRRSRQEMSKRKKIRWKNGKHKRSPSSSCSWSSPSSSSTSSSVSLFSHAEVENFILPLAKEKAKSLLPATTRTSSSSSSTSFASSSSSASSVSVTHRNASAGGSTPSDGHPHQRTPDTPRRRGTNNSAPHHSGSLSPHKHQKKRASNTPPFPRIPSHGSSDTLRFIIATNTLDINTPTQFLQCLVNAWLREEQHSSYVSSQLHRIERSSHMWRMMRRRQLHKAVASPWNDSWKGRKCPRRRSKGSDGEEKRTLFSTPPSHLSLHSHSRGVAATSSSSSFSSSCSSCSSSDASPLALPLYLTPLLQVVPSSSSSFPVTPPGSAEASATVGPSRTAAPPSPPFTRVGGHHNTFPNRGGRIDEGDGAEPPLQGRDLILHMKQCLPFLFSYAYLASPLLPASLRMSLPPLHSPPSSSESSTASTTRTTHRPLPATMQTGEENTASTVPAKAQKEDPAWSLVRAYVHTCYILAGYILLQGIPPGWWDSLSDQAKKKTIIGRVVPWVYQQLLVAREQWDPVSEASSSSSAFMTKTMSFSSLVEEAEMYFVSPSSPFVVPDATATAESSALSFVSVDSTCRMHGGRMDARKANRETVTPEEGGREEKNQPDRMLARCTTLYIAHTASMIVVILLHVLHFPYSFQSLTDRVRVTGEALPSGCPAPEDFVFFWSELHLPVCSMYLAQLPSPLYDQGLWHPLLFAVTKLYPIWRSSWMKDSEKRPLRAFSQGIVCHSTPGMERTEKVHFQKKKTPSFAVEGRSMAVIRQATKESKQSGRRRGSFVSQRRSSSSSSFPSRTSSGTRMGRLEWLLSCPPLTIVREMVLATSILNYWHAYIRPLPPVERSLFLRYGSFRENKAWVAVLPCSSLDTPHSGSYGMRGRTGEACDGALKRRRTSKRKAHCSSAPPPFLVPYAVAVALPSDLYPTPKKPWEGGPPSHLLSCQESSSSYFRYWSSTTLPSFPLFFLRPLSTSSSSSLSGDTTNTKQVTPVREWTTTPALSSSTRKPNDKVVWSESTMCTLPMRYTSLHFPPYLLIHDTLRLPLRFLTGTQVGLRDTLATRHGDTAMPNSEDNDEGGRGVDVPCTASPPSSITTLSTPFFHAPLDPRGAVFFFADLYRFPLSLLHAYRRLVGEVGESLLPMKEAFNAFFALQPIRTVGALYRAWQFLLWTNLACHHYYLTAQASHITRSSPSLPFPHTSGRGVVGAALPCPPSPSSSTETRKSQKEGEPQTGGRRTKKESTQEETEERREVASSPESTGLPSPSSDSLPSALDSKTTHVMNAARRKRDATKTTPFRHISSPSSSPITESIVVPPHHTVDPTMLVQHYQATAEEAATTDFLVLGLLEFLRLNGVLGMESTIALSFTHAAVTPASIIAKQWEKPFGRLEAMLENALRMSKWTRRRCQEKHEGSAAPPPHTSRKKHPGRTRPTSSSSTGITKTISAFPRLPLPTFLFLQLAMGPHSGSGWTEDLLSCFTFSGEVRKKKRKKKKHHTKRKDDMEAAVKPPTRRAPFSGTLCSPSSGGHEKGPVWDGGTEPVEPTAVCRSPCAIDAAVGGGEGGVHPRWASSPTATTRIPQTTAAMEEKTNEVHTSEDPTTHGRDGVEEGEDQQEEGKPAAAGGTIHPTRLVAPTGSPTPPPRGEASAWKYRHRQKSASSSSSSPPFMSPVPFIPSLRLTVPCVWGTACPICESLLQHPTWRNLRPPPCPPFLPLASPSYRKISRRRGTPRTLRRARRPSEGEVDAATTTTRRRRRACVDTSQLESGTPQPSWPMAHHAGRLSVELVSRSPISHLSSPPYPSPTSSFPRTTTIPMSFASPAGTAVRPYRHSHLPPGEEGLSSPTSHRTSLPSTEVRASRSFSHSCFSFSMASSHETKTTSCGRSPRPTTFQTILSTSTCTTTATTSSSSSLDGVGSVSLSSRKEETFASLPSFSPFPGRRFGPSHTQKRDDRERERSPHHLTKRGKKKPHCCQACPLLFTLPPSSSCSSVFSFASFPVQLLLPSLDPALHRFNDPRLSAPVRPRGVLHRPPAFPAFSSRRGVPNESPSSPPSGSPLSFISSAFPAAMLSATPFPRTEWEGASGMGVHSPRHRKSRPRPSVSSSSSSSSLTTEASLECRRRRRWAVRMGEEEGAVERGDPFGAPPISYQERPHKEALRHEEEREEVGQDQTSPASLPQKCHEHVSGLLPQRGGDASTHAGAAATSPLPPLPYSSSVELVEDEEEKEDRLAALHPWFLKPQLYVRGDPLHAASAYRVYEQLCAAMEAAEEDDEEKEDEEVEGSKRRQAKAKHHKHKKERRQDASDKEIASVPVSPVGSPLPTTTIPSFPSCERRTPRRPPEGFRMPSSSPPPSMYLSPPQSSYGSGSLLLTPSMVPPAASQWLHTYANTIQGRLRLGAEMSILLFNTSELIHHHNHQEWRRRARYARWHAWRRRQKQKRSEATQQSGEETLLRLPSSPTLPSASLLCPSRPLPYMDPRRSRRPRCSPVAHFFGVREKKSEEGKEDRAGLGATGAPPPADVHVEKKERVHHAGGTPATTTTTSTTTTMPLPPTPSTSCTLMASSAGLPGCSPVRSPPSFVGVGKNPPNGTPGGATLEEEEELQPPARRHSQEVPQDTASWQVSPLCSSHESSPFSSSTRDSSSASFSSSWRSSPSKKRSIMRVEEKSSSAGRVPAYHSSRYYYDDDDDNEEEKEEEEGMPCASGCTRGGFLPSRLRHLHVFRYTSTPPRLVFPVAPPSKSGTAFRSSHHRHHHPVEGMAGPAEGNAVPHVHDTTNTTLYFPFLALLQFMLHHLVVFLWSGTEKEKEVTREDGIPCAARGKRSAPQSKVVDGRGKRILSTPQQECSFSSSLSLLFPTPQEDRLDVEGVLRQLERNMRRLPLFLRYLFSIQQWVQQGWRSRDIYACLRGRTPRGKVGDTKEEAVEKKISLAVPSHHPPTACPSRGRVETTPSPSCGIERHAASLGMETSLPREDSTAMPNSRSLSPSSTFHPSTVTPPVRDLPDLTGTSCGLSGDSKKGTCWGVPGEGLPAGPSFIASFSSLIPPPPPPPRRLAPSETEEGEGERFPFSVLDAQLLEAYELYDRLALLPLLLRYTGCEVGGFLPMRHAVRVIARRWERFQRQKKRKNRKQQGRCTVDEDQKSSRYASPCSRTPRRRAGRRKENKGVETQEGRPASPPPTSTPIPSSSARATGGSAATAMPSVRLLLHCIINEFSDLFTVSRGGNSPPPVSSISFSSFPI